MSRTITITQDGAEHTIHLDRFAADAKHIQQSREFGSTWSHTWLRAGLITFQDNGDVSLTPRGEDLLATIPLLPAKPKPETAAKPCSKCNGSGEQPLFVSMETCSRCKGSKVEPRASGVDLNKLVDAFTGVLKLPYEIEVTRGRTSSSRPNTDTLPRIGYSAFVFATPSGEVIERASEHPWVLIDSEEVARQFIGKRVQVDAPATADGISAHELHGTITQVKGMSARCSYILTTTGEFALGWENRRNVRLRLVDGDPS